MDFVYFCFIKQTKELYSKTIFALNSKPFQVFKADWKALNSKHQVFSSRFIMKLSLYLKDIFDIIITWRSYSFVCVQTGKFNTNQAYSYPRDYSVFRHHGAQLRVTLKALGPSQHYRNLRFVGAHNWTPIMPRDTDRGNICEIFISVQKNLF